MTHNSLLAYGFGFQIKVISLLLHNKEFLINIHDLIEPEHFKDEGHKWIIEYILKYFSKYHTNPSPEIIQAEIKKEINETLKISVIEQLKEAYRLHDDKDLQYVKDEYCNFCMNQSIKKALTNSVELLKMGDYDGIKQLMGRALKSNQNKDIGHIYDKDVESRYRDDDRAPIPFPWKGFNDVTGGGYGKGELLLIFGLPKGGKSWIAIAMAAYAALMGKKIVYYSLELGEGYVGKRFDAVLTDIALDQLKFNREKVNEVVATVKDRIVIKEFPAGRASLDTLESHLDQLEHQHDFKPDAIFCDYLDLLKNRNTFRKERKDDLDDVYTDARGLARERKVPFISPSQINRAGANDDIIESDKIAGSFSKAMICDFAVSLSRKRKDKVEGKGKLHIMASRIGPDSITFLARIDTSRGKIDVDDLPIDEDGDVIEGKADKNDFQKMDNDDKKFLRDRYLEINSKQ